MVVVNKFFLLSVATFFKKSVLIRYIFQMFLAKFNFYALPVIDSTKFESQQSDMSLISFKSFVKFFKVSLTSLINFHFVTINFNLFISCFRGHNPLLQVHTTPLKTNSTSLQKKNSIIFSISCKKMLRS